MSSADEITITGSGKEYIGKRLLVGVTYETPKGELIRQEQFHGIIIAANETGIVIIRDDNGEEQSLPAQLKKANPGRYRLLSTGETVINPDYLATWLITKSTDKRSHRE